MDQIIKEVWINALTSGAYEPGKGALRRPKPDGSGDAYCCLGVLCEIAVKEGIIPPAKQPEPDDYDFSGYDPKKAPYFYGGKGDEPSGSSGFLPEEVMNWAALSSFDPAARAPLHEQAGGVDGMVRLSSLNDSGDYTFQYIARFIAENF